MGRCFGDFLDENGKEQACERIGMNDNRRNCNRDFEITSLRDQELKVTCGRNAEDLRAKKPSVSSSCHHGILIE